MPFHHNTFVVRLWWAESHSADGRSARRWYGRIEHVQSGEGADFHDVHALLRFIESFTGAIFGPESGGEGGDVNVASTEGGDDST